MKRDAARLEWIEFQRLSGRFDEEPSIANYVALRRSFPGGDSEIHQLAVVDPGQAEAFELDLERARLSRALVRGALGGDDRAIDELCLQLMERLIERRAREGRGETQLQSRGAGISDALVGHLIGAMLESASTRRLKPHALSCGPRSRTTWWAEQRGRQESQNVEGPKASIVLGNANEAAGRATDNPQSRNGIEGSAKHGEPLVPGRRFSKTDREVRSLIQGVRDRPFLG